MKPTFQTSFSTRFRNSDITTNRYQSLYSIANTAKYLQEIQNYETSSSNLSAMIGPDIAENCSLEQSAVKQLQFRYLVMSSKPFRGV